MQTISQSKLKGHVTDSALLRDKFLFSFEAVDLFGRL